MATKLVIATVLAVTIGCFLSFGNKANFLSGAGRGHSSGVCGKDARVEENIRKLSDGLDEGRIASQSLIDYAQKSGGCRQEIVDKVLSLMRITNPRSGPNEFQLWMLCSGVLRELKPVEAMDLWIDNLELHAAIFSSSGTGEPIMLTVNRMGELAIPKLTYALRYHPDRQIRMDSAYCLVGIGGEKAIEALKGSIDIETDGCVRDYVQNCLKSLDPDSHLVPFSDEDRKVRSKVLDRWCRQ